VLIFIAATLSQGPAPADMQFQQAQAARTVYAACLFRENDERRRTGVPAPEKLGSSCEAERSEIARLDRAAEIPADVSAAGMKGMDDTLRESITRMNRFYPTKPL
jgi:hypothetical protein